MPERRYRRLIMLGCAFEARGGIAAVVDAYRAQGLFERWPIEYIPTHCDGGALRKLLTAIKALLRLISLLAVHRRVIMHVHSASRASFWRKSVFMTIGILARCPVILHLHGGGFSRFYEAQRGAAGRSVIRFLLDRAACVVVVSDHWRSWVAKITRNPSVVCIPNAVQAVAGQAAAERQHVVLFLGRLAAGKGIHELLEAFARLRAAIPDIRLVCAGDGDLESVARHAERLGMAHAVSLPGWIGPADKQSLLNRAAVFVLPSHAEGLPMSLLEAMAAGLPVVATAVGGIPEVVTDGVDGFLFSPGDTATLERLLRKLMHDPDLRGQLAAAAQETVRRRFTAGRMLEQLDELYSGLGLAPGTHRAAASGVATNLNALFASQPPPDASRR